MLQNDRSVNTIFHDRIRIFSFVLTVLVIWIHAVEPGFAAGDPVRGTEDIYRILQSFLGSCLGQIAVPGFFCMSGYLFFRGGRPLFREKLRKRVRTLLIPYILWNTVYYAVYILAGRAETGLLQLAEAVMDHRFNPVFWYLKELIVITVLTPLIYLLIKDRRAVLPVLGLVFLSACIYDMIPFHAVNEDALFYFMTGAALALHAGKRETDTSSIKVLWAAGTAGFLLSDILCGGQAMRIIIAGTIAKRICGVLGLFALVSLLTGRKKSEDNTASAWFMNYNFFVYAVHYLEIRAFRYGLSAAFSGNVPDTAAALLYVCMPALCIAVAAVTGAAAKKIVPGLYYIFTGGRS